MKNQVARKLELSYFESGPFNIRVYAIDPGVRLDVMQIDLGGFQTGFGQVAKKGETSLPILKTNLLVMKKIHIFYILFIVLNIPLRGQSIPVPANYVILDSAAGDLDKDGIQEMVAAFDTRKPIEDFDNISRELYIYKKKSDNWILWKKSEQALYGSRDGGMMGDPFNKIEITNGILLISQTGGSSWKWNVTDKYRYQNGEFYLIGYSSIYGKPCEYWTEIDFNLNTGKLVAGKEYEDCQGDEPKTIKKEKETIWKKGIKIKLQERNKKEIKFTTPRYKHEIYIAEKNE